MQNWDSFHVNSYFFVKLSKAETVLLLKAEKNWELLRILNKSQLQKWAAIKQTIFFVDKQNWVAWEQIGAEGYYHYHPLCSFTNSVVSEPTVHLWYFLI